MPHQARETPVILSKPTGSRLNGAAFVIDELAQVRSYIQARAEARRNFGKEIFSDPAWDMLVQLYASQLSQHRIALSRLCGLSQVAGGTGKRWLDILETNGEIERIADPLDRRRTWVNLTPAGSSKMKAYFKAIA